MYELAYLPLVPPAVKKRARPFSAGALFALTVTWSPRGVLEYALMTLACFLLLSSYPFEGRPVRREERFLNAVIGGTSLAVAVGLYRGREIGAVLGLAVPFLLLRNRVLVSFGLPPASALYLIGHLRVPEGVRFGLFTLTYVYSLHNLRKLLR